MVSSLSQWSYCLQFFSHLGASPGSLCHGDPASLLVTVRFPNLVISTQSCFSIVPTNWQIGTSLLSNILRSFSNDQEMRSQFANLWQIGKLGPLFCPTF